MTTIRLPNTPFSFSRFSTFYVVLFIALAAAAGVVVYSSHSSTKRYNTISTAAVDRLNVLLGLREEADATQLATLRMIFNTEPGDVQNEQMTIREIHARYRNNWNAYQRLIDPLGAQAGTSSLLYFRRQDCAARDRLLELSDMGPALNDSAINLYYTLQKPAYERYQQSIEVLSDHVNRQIRLELAGTDQFVATSSALVNALLIASFGIMLVGGALIV
nr:MCP four helix bundle domain-containing protein [Chitinophagaceae bacterium]